MAKERNTKKMMMMKTNKKNMCCIVSIRVFFGVFLEICTERDGHKMHRYGCFRLQSESMTFVKMANLFAAFSYCILLYF
jgi:hypothetical protein